MVGCRGDQGDGSQNSGGLLDGHYALAEFGGFADGVLRHFHEVGRVGGRGVYAVGGFVAIDG